MPRCTACGTDNKAVAKFCRQCGASMVKVPQAEDDDRTVIIPASPAQRQASPPASASGDAPLGKAVPPPTPQRGTDAAKAARPSKPDKPVLRTGPIMALAVAALAVIGGGYFAWNAMSGKPPAVPVEQTPAPQPGPPATAAQSAPAAAESLPPSLAVPPQAESTAPPATAEEPAKPVGETTPEPVATPPVAASTEKMTQAKNKATAKAARAERRKREAAEKARRAASASAPAVEQAAPPAPPEPKPDPEAARWATMKRELSECGGLNVFCREGVRWKYCNGYWGKVSACPGSNR